MLNRNCCRFVCFIPTPGLPVIGFAHVCIFAYVEIYAWQDWVNERSIEFITC